MRLGTCSDGRVISYHSLSCEFRLGKEAVPYRYISTVDEQGLIRWERDAHREWFRGLGQDGAEACRQNALEDAKQRKAVHKEQGLVNQLEGYIARAREALSEEEYAWN